MAHVGCTYVAPCTRYTRYWTRQSFPLGCWLWIRRWAAVAREVRAVVHVRPDSCVFRRFPDVNQTASTTFCCCGPTSRTPSSRVMKTRRMSSFSPETFRSVFILSRTWMNWLRFINCVESCRIFYFVNAVAMFGELAPYANEQVNVPPVSVCVLNSINIVTQSVCVCSLVYCLARQYAYQTGWNVNLNSFFFTLKYFIILRLLWVFLLSSL